MLPQNKNACKEARHAEVARRYAWDVRRRAERSKPDKAQLIALLRSDATVHVRLSGIPVAAVAGG
jgi:hypothetical protein